MFFRTPLSLSSEIWQPLVIRRSARTPKCACVALRASSWRPAPGLAGPPPSRGQRVKSLGCPASRRSPGSSASAAAEALRHGRPWQESCKVPRGVGRSEEEEKRKRRTRLSSRGDRGVPWRLSRSSPRAARLQPFGPGWALETRPEAAEELSLRAATAGLIVCSNSPGIRRGRTGPRVHWDLSRVPAAAVAAAETPFVLPGPPSLSFMVAAAGWR